MKAKQSRFVAAGVIILIAGALGLAGWYEMRSNAILACVVSIHQGLVNLNLSETDLPGVKTEWTILSEPESSRLIFAASKIHSFDCAKVLTGETYLDYWGRPLQVAAAKLPERKIIYRVWSKGWDGESGTWDDYVSPFGEKAIIIK